MNLNLGKQEEEVNPLVPRGGCGGREIWREGRSWAGRKVFKARGSTEVAGCGGLEPERSWKRLAFLVKGKGT